MASPSSLPFRKAIPDLEVFLKGISQEEPVGPFLRYDPLYDEVRLARQEDDPRLSMGIWKTDLKRADWGLVEALCVEALTAKSKDLQLAAWLTEAWTSLDGIEGYIRGIQLLAGLSETFWKIIHPQPQEDEDMESRQMIFEWMDTALSSRLMLIPLTQSKYDQTAFGLGFFKSAQHSDASQKRTEKANTPSSKNDPSKTIGTVEEFQRSLDHTPDSYLSKQQQNFAQASQSTQTLKNTLASLWGAASPSFSRILGTLKEMERILTTTLQTRTPPSPVPEPAPEMVKTMASPSPETPVAIPSAAPSLLEETTSGKLGLKTRDDAYRHLEIVATFLEQNDPHSLAPQLIRQLIRWEHQNILDILGEIAQSPQEYDMLMKILGFSSSEE